MFQEVTSHTKLQDVSLLGTQFLTDDAFKNLANTKSLHRIRIEGKWSSWQKYMNWINAEIQYP